MDTHAYEVGSWVLGVRCSNTATDAAIQRILAAHQRDLEAPPNFSLLMGDDRHRRGFNFLYRSSQSVVRTRAPGRVVRALLQYLAAFAEPRPETLQLGATGFVGDGIALIAPYELRIHIEAIQTRLDRSGLQVIDVPWLHLDPSSGELVVPEPALDIDRKALADFEKVSPVEGRELPPVAPGRYPVAAWAFITGQDTVGPLGRAQATAAAAAQVVNADQFGADRTLLAVANVTQVTATQGIWWQNSADLATQLCSLARGASVAP